MLPVTVARSSSGRVLKSQGEGQFWGIFFPIDKALYSKTKMAEPIKMPFVMMKGLGPRTVCYVGITIPKGKGQF